MEIVDFLSPEDIIPELNASSMEGALREFAGHLKSREIIKDTDGLVEVLLDREKLGSTGIGNGVAIPHGRLPDINGIVVVFGRSTKGIEFNAHDQEPVHLLFLLVAPEDSGGDHLKTLARISRIIKSPDCRRALMESTDDESLYRVISEEDKRH
ncbi:MAG: PTS sugar transporter subunit IIA [Deltaproteobacteria bacterium]|nr:PTS sugar transporter subunit IIA [Deltaproteobacteria bacterium]